MTTPMFLTNNRLRYVGDRLDLPSAGMATVNEYVQADELEYVDIGACSCNGCMYDGEHLL